MCPNDLSSNPCAILLGKVRASRKGRYGREMRRHEGSTRASWVERTLADNRLTSVFC